MPHPFFAHRPALRGGALSLLYLPTSVVLAFAATRALGALAPALQSRVGPPLFLATVFVCAAAGGAAWGRDIARRLPGPPAPARAAGGAALGFGTTVALAIWGLASAESTLLERAQNGGGIPMHVAFDLLFPGAATLVVFGTVLGLASGARLGARAARLALRCAAAAGVAFAGVALVMDLAGWRVGAPDAETRLTMLVVTALGLLAATLAGGVALGGALPLAAPRRSSRSG